MANCNSCGVYYHKDVGPDTQSLVQECDACSWERRQEARKLARTNFRTACEAGDYSQINELFQSGKLDDTDAQTLVTWTIGKGMLEPTRCLLEHGADAKAIQTWRLDKCRSLDIFKLLAEFGHDYNAFQHNILQHVTDDREILDWLLDQGLDINRGDDTTSVKASDHVYRNSICAVLNTAALDGDIALFDHLVARGAEPSRSNALHQAALCKDHVKTVAMITHLIEKYHFDPNADDRCGGLNELVGWDVCTGNPLNYAVCRSNIPAAEALLKYGANPSNSLQMAIGKKQAPAVKLLLEAGANDPDSFGHAVTGNYLESAELCLQYGADPAAGELYDKQLADNPGVMYSGMTTEMRKLLDEWKTKRKAEAENTELKVGPATPQ